MSMPPATTAIVPLSRLAVRAERRRTDILAAQQP
jgi:hypothetical protein